MRRTRAFTLIEILVVIAIVGLLAGLLIPAVARSRAKAAQARCGLQLQQVGQMLQMYFGENRNALPNVNMMPSLQPPLNGYPSLVQVLAPYHRGGVQVFDCPADQITQPAPNAPPGFETYFAREQSSYQWNADVNLGASRVTDLKNADAVPLVQEYEPFHGHAGMSGSMNRLYLDLHVDGSVQSRVVIGG
jgi:prepilin-type N-terminal cleavage/methylation domain-containing protein